MTTKYLIPTLYRVKWNGYLVTIDKDVDGFLVSDDGNCCYYPHQVTKLYIPNIVTIKKKKTRYGLITLLIYVILLFISITSHLY